MDLELKKFQQEMDEVRQDLEKTIRNVRDDISTVLFKGIVNRSPVKTGKFKRAWKIGIDKELKTTKSSSMEFELKKIKTAKTFENIYISNGWRYIFMLEFGRYKPSTGTVGGFSKKAPRGMVRVSIEEAKLIAPVIVKARDK